MAPLASPAPPAPSSRQAARKRVVDFEVGQVVIATARKRVRAEVKEFFEDS